VSTTCESEVPRRRIGWPLRVAAAAALAGVGFAAIVRITHAAGFGNDLHALRVAATIAVLFAAMLVILAPGRDIWWRIASFAVGVVLAPLAWWLVPCNLSGGPSLLDAVTDRIASKAKLDSYSDRINYQPEITVELIDNHRRRIAELESHYPSIAEQMQVGMDNFQTAEVDARITELRELSATDPAGFTRTSSLRKELAKALPQSRQQLIAAEEAWAMRWAGYTAVAYTEGDMSPAHARKGLRDSEKLLLEFPTIDDSPRRLLTGRMVFFVVAQESAENEIAALHAEGHFDRAFTVAFNHHLAWANNTELLTSEGVKRLEALRDRCQALRRPGGDPDTLPPPRVIETAPVPRPKG
jgi:hypothetical protein